MISGDEYDIAQADGHYAGGTIRVQIAALGAKKKYSTNASGGGPMVSVREQLIPPRYNRRSTLCVTISADPAQNQHDFDLKEQKHPCLRPAYPPNTDVYTSLDPWHYGTASNIDFGWQFDKAIAELVK